MNIVALACAPEHNISVMASAGTGKTWLLVTRLIRLLMAGAPPTSLLAITFTRKAATEMRTRLMQRLLEMAAADDAALRRLLDEIGADTEPHTMSMARNLYETLLRSEHPVRITTFHAFCQDILQRFPVEAGIPAGFDLLEASGLIEQEAWDALWAESTTPTGKVLTRALDALLAHCGSVSRLRNILQAFIGHRSDWWALTHGQANALDAARHHLQQQLGIDPAIDPTTHYFNPSTVADLAEYLSLLQQHPTQTNLSCADRISLALEHHHTNPSSAVQHIIAVFFKNDGDRKRISESQILKKKLGATGEQRLISLHDRLGDDLASLIDLRNRHITWQLSSNWFYAGQRLLQHFQRIKEEQRLLDFTDLEWRTYLLLNSDHGLWIQFKLDQRINHILIDEFQDTNPTQWRLLQPLIEEMAQGYHQQPGSRSVFLVGDSKQSIYRFRRANPLLFISASNWLQHNMNGRQLSLVNSRRSSPAIIQFVNRIFSGSALNGQLDNFKDHQTIHDGLWGRVEVLPLIAQQSFTTITNSEGAGAPLRNPLERPRLQHQNENYHLEGQLICRIIHQLVAEQTCINTPEPHLAGYRDMMILVRNRTHLHWYEQALREAGIPYHSSGGAPVTECLEIQDMIALLESLITPFDNLALAKILRSPLFDCSDDDLIRLAQLTTQQSAWLDALHTADTVALQRAAALLDRWRRLAQQLPVHDLLDRIYNEGNVIDRYLAAFPAHLHSRLTSNLTYLLELALEIDSGRYPSLPQFLARLSTLQQYAIETLKDAAAGGDSNRVRILTIHAAKGLESPVVFLADCGPQSPRHISFQPVVDWPAQAGRPELFLLAGRSSQTDLWTQQQTQRIADLQRTEDANLLYVAVTRAKQLLFITGSEARVQSLPSWHSIISACMEDWEHVNQQEPGHYIFETDYRTTEPSTTADPSTLDNNPPATELTLPLQPFSTAATLLPSSSSLPTAENLASQRRGQAIHRMLELLTGNPDASHQEILSGCAHAYGLTADDPRLADWLQEACNVIAHPDLRHWFDPQCYQRAWNEISISFIEDGRPVQGIIDRLIESDHGIIIIDYKTHIEATPPNAATLARPYQPQMYWYAAGIRRIWPSAAIRCIAIFTRCACYYEFADTADYQIASTPVGDLVIATDNI
ncbi:MAG: UvrD-helicase domain-containing protein [Gammaproteobacteria bacterium]|nr:UvrD-helicase domain-containing protein [Gammaproteobacteria bacterium]